jgi:hypothetical protein
LKKYDFEKNELMHIYSIEHKQNNRPIHRISIMLSSMKEQAFRRKTYGTPISTTGDDVIRLVFPTPDETETRVDLGTNPFTTYAVATKTPHSRLLLNFVLKFFIFYFSVSLSYLLSFCQIQNPKI